jgi:hypothetical protein
VEVRLRRLEDLPTPPRICRTRKRKWTCQSTRRSS